MKPTPKYPRLDDGDTFEHEGRSFKVTIKPDDSGETPWESSDGHGPVSDWRRHNPDTGRPAKRAGERLLFSDGRSARFYDWAKAIKLAQKDGWGTLDARHPDETLKHYRARAVEADFEYLRRWCEGDWYYVGVIVTLLDDEGAETDESESLWGIESESPDYLTETAYELAEEINSRQDEAESHEVICVACKGTGKIRV